MGKVDGLLARARETMPGADPEETDEELLPLDEVLDRATEAERQTEWTTGPAPVVEAAPVVRAVERLHQGVRTDLHGVLAAAREQETYLREWKRAYNAMTTEWYRITDELPQARAALDDLRTEIAQRRTEMTAIGTQVGDEIREAIAEQRREVARTIWQIRMVALVAVGLIALACLVGLTAMAILAATVLHHPL